MIADYKAGLIHARSLEDALEPEPHKLKKPTRSWCQWFRRVWGWGMYTRSADAQQWLPYDHCDMQAARQNVVDMLDPAKGGVHPGLILNYDQVWRNSYQCSHFKIAHKSRVNFGKRTKRTRPNPQFDKKAHTIKGARNSLTVPCRFIMQNNNI